MLPTFASSLTSRPGVINSVCESLWSKILRNCCGEHYSFKKGSQCTESLPLRRGYFQEHVWAWPIARGAAKPWEPSGTAVCETSAASLRTIELAFFFFDWRQKFCTQTAPRFGVQKRTPKTGGQVVRTKQIKLRLNKWPPFLESVSGLQKGGRFWTPKMEPFVGKIFGYRAKNGKSFDCFCTYAAVPLLFHVLQRRGTVFAGFLGPRLVSRKITFFDPLKEQKVAIKLADQWSAAFFGSLLKTHSLHFVVCLNFG